MRVVADTNTIVSGLLWRGTPHLLLDHAREGTIKLLTSPALLMELEDVLRRPKFAQRLEMAGVEAHDLALDYAALAEIVEPDVVETVIEDDPDDDEVLACALTAGADVIASGDRHLMALGEYRGILVLSASELIQKVSSDG
jgi:putative PIN family toxin of toxin-antitoxin system